MKNSNILRGDLRCDCGSLVARITEAEHRTACRKSSEVAGYCGLGQEQPVQKGGRGMKVAGAKIYHDNREASGRRTQSPLY